MVVPFHNDERGYAAWMYVNPDGYVFNHFGGRDSGYNVVHRARCSFLRRAVDVGARTTVPKVCGEKREEVEAEASRLRDGPRGWKHCGVCMR